MVKKPLGENRECPDGDCDSVWNARSSRLFQQAVARQDDGSYVDVELPRAQYAQLRERLSLAPGALVHLKARRITRFAAESAS